MNSQTQAVWQDQLKRSLASPTMVSVYKCSDPISFAHYVERAKETGSVVVVSPLLFKTMMQWDTISEILTPFINMTALKSGVIGESDQVLVYTDALLPQADRVNWPGDYPMLAIV